MGGGNGLQNFKVSSIARVLTLAGETFRKKRKLRSEGGGLPATLEPLNKKWRRGTPSSMKKKGMKSPRFGLMKNIKKLGNK